MLVTRIVAGGQSGADRAALDVALSLGLPYGGWCPPGGWAEDHPVPPGVLARYPGLREVPDGGTTTRTQWNVRDSDATLVLGLHAAASPGTELTLAAASALGRPCLSASAEDVRTVERWLASLGRPMVLNVAGPRESEAPGLYDVVYRTLTTVLLA